jgi:hypothetical protein
LLGGAILKVEVALVLCLFEYHAGFFLSASRRLLQAVALSLSSR